MSAVLSFLLSVGGLVLEEYKNEQDYFYVSETDVKVVLCGFIYIVLSLLNNQDSLWTWSGASAAPRSPLLCSVSALALAVAELVLL